MMSDIYARRRRLYFISVYQAGLLRFGGRLMCTYVSQEIR